MALPASSVSSPPLNFQIRFCKNIQVQLHSCTLVSNSLLLYPRFSRVTINGNAHFRKQGTIKLQSSTGAERLWEAAPKPVKEFPWRKAADVLLERSLVIGKTTLKWSLITIFVCSSIADVIFSVSRNWELLIPVGLLTGILMADFLKETLQELFSSFEGKGLNTNMPLVVISCLFVLVRAASSFFATPTRVLLLHVANGGLLQVLWIWRNLFVENPPFTTSGEK